MIRYLAAAALSLVAVQPASAAELFDYDVYATGNAYISGGSYGAIASGSFVNANGPTGTNYASWTSSSPALDSSANGLSAQLAALAATGTVTYGQWTPGDITLTGTGTGVNVFNLTGIGTPQWSSLYALTFAGPGTGAIVNVWGSSLTNYVNLNFGGLATDKIIFNFFQADNVKLEGMNVKGSILAPDALVRIQGGSVDGTVIADRFHSEGTRIGGTGFNGFTPAPPLGAVPEPSTWAMIVLGFGLLGGALRRRRPAEALRLRVA